MFKNLNIGTRLGLGFGLVLILLTILSTLSIFKLSEMEASILSLTDNRYPKTVLANEIAYATMDATRVVRNLILQSDETARAASKAALDKDRAKINENFEQLEKVTVSVKGKELIRNMIDTRAAFRSYTDEVVGLAMNNKRDEATKVLYGENYKTQTAYLAAVKQFVEFQGSRMLDASNQAIEDYHLARNLTVMLSAVALVVGLVVAFWVTHSITAPISQAVDVANRLSDGDLNVRIEIRSNDETGKLLVAMQNMVNKMKNMIGEVMASADQLSKTASQLSVSSKQVANGSQQQSEATSSMAASLEEMTVSINQVTDNALSAREASLHSGEMSEQGAGVIHDAVLEMGKIEVSVKGFSSIIQSLEQQSNEISAIVNVIKEIADQTNLLALNAAIEAARAGEQGRGFAVVADEVRKLAERTSKSTQEIGSMIEKIQSGTREAVTSIESGVSTVISGVALANKAGDSITQIKAEAAHVAQVVSDISDALKEQSIASNDVAKNVERIAQMTEENNAAVLQSSSAANHLEQLATSLHSSISHFKI